MSSKEFKGAAQGGVEYLFEPREDITPLQVCDCLTVLLTASAGGNVKKAYEQIPVSSQRHFQVIKE